MSTPFTTPFPSDRLMTVGEVAHYLQVSEMTVYRMITDRRIAASKVGRVWRIAVADLDAYLQACRVPIAS